MALGQSLADNKVRPVVCDHATVLPDGSGVLVRRGPQERVLKAQHVIIATGSRPARPSNIPFTSGAQLPLFGETEATQQHSGAESANSG